jgi:DNA gyrase subunit A
MNTDKICIFTDNGNLHQIKVSDIPFTKFRDKGTPIDNLGNYDSSGENIIYLSALEQLKNKKMLFATKQGMVKLVDTSEFEVSKRTVAATKLQEDDELLGVYFTDARKETFSSFSLEGEVKEEDIIVSNQNVVLQTSNGMFLRFPLSDVPEKKKGAVGVRGIKLAEGDSVEEVYLFSNTDSVSMDYKGKQISFDKLKMAHRDTKGTKVRV